jgi:hypothetical protein
MGTFANSRLVRCLAWLIALLIVSINVNLVASLLRGQEPRGFSAAALRSDKITI